MLACHNYHDIANSLPARMSGLVRATNWTDGSDNEERRRVSAWVAIFPALEQSALYDQVRDAQVNYTNGSTWQGLRPGSDSPSGASSNVGVNIKLPFMICPSEAAPNAPDGAYCRNNYVFCEGDFCGRGETFEGKKGHNKRGAFVEHAWRNFSAIQDGTSNTAGISERCVHFGEGRKIKSSIASSVSSVQIMSGFANNNGEVTNEVPNVFNPQNCQLLKTSTGEYSSTVSNVGYRSGRRWMSGEPVYGAFNTVLPPNSPSYSTSNASSDPCMLPPTSYHSGGVTVGLLDGSVRFVSDTVHPGDQTAKCVQSGTSPYGVWGALGSINGGEATPSL
jgi:prepilin-type processing-associated H-X9-DG protein